MSGLDRVEDLAEPGTSGFDVPEEDPAALNGSGALRDRLRARREEIRQSKTIDLLIPGYGDDLAARYRAIPGEQAEKIASKMGRSGEGLKVAINLLIKTCETILVRPEGGKLEPLKDSSGIEIKFDTRLSEYLGFEAEKASDVVMGTFSPEGNRDLAPYDAANALTSWLQGRDHEIDQSLLGE